MPVVIYGFGGVHSQDTSIPTAAQKQIQEPGVLRLARAWFKN